VIAGRTVLEGGGGVRGEEGKGAAPSAEPELQPSLLGTRTCQMGPQDGRCGARGLLGG
jgi:hypothetical protein